MAVDFGSDISLAQDLAADGHVVTGRTLVAEAIVRRLITPRGQLIRDPNYGYDITQFINDEVGPADLAAMKALAAQECLKDERVSAATVSAEVDRSGVLIVTVSLETAAGPFTLTLSVADAALKLFQVS